MGDHVTRRSMPVEQSILWKPLHDPHYVVASLQPNDGGRRKIFVRQQALGRIEALVRAHGRRTFGLLIGQFFHCPVTDSEYLAIESVAEQNPAHDDTDMADGIGEALAARPAEKRAHVMGWFRGVPAVEARPSLTTGAAHTSGLHHPWQTTLVVGEGLASGAFFLRDTVNSRWFCAPFYELMESALAAHHPKPTLVNWPQQYITTDSVTPADRDLIPKLELADTRAAYERPTLARTAAKEPEVRAAPRHEPDDIPLPIPEAPTLSSSPVGSDGSVATGASDPVTFSDRPASRPVPDGLADASQPTRERPLSRRNQRSGEKLSIVDDRDQRMTSPASRRITDADDSTEDDDPARYIELARVEGFFIAAKFDTRSGLGPAETLWVLNEPYSGMLLTVVTTATEVVDATLQYNLQTDDAGLRRVAFPEHREEESKTIYVRETCIDSLRARCRRLRATNALLREWKVTPKISLLTPGEWEALPSLDASGHRGLAGVGELSDARIAELPSGVRTQFHLGGPVNEATA